MFSDDLDLLDRQAWVVTRDKVLHVERCSVQAVFALWALSTSQPVTAITRQSLKSCVLFFVFCCFGNFDGYTVFLFRHNVSLCLLYKIIHKLCYFDDGILSYSSCTSQPCVKPPLCSYEFLLLFICTIHYFFFSFWNNLDSSLVCASSVSAFKCNLHFH